MPLTLTPIDWPKLALLNRDLVNALAEVRDGLAVSTSAWITALLTPVFHDAGVARVSTAACCPDDLDWGDRDPREPVFVSPGKRRSLNTGEWAKIVAAVELAHARLEFLAIELDDYPKIAARLGRAVDELDAFRLKADQVVERPRGDIRQPATPQHRSKVKPASTHTPHGRQKRPAR